MVAAIVKGERAAALPFEKLIANLERRDRRKRGDSR